MKTFLKLFAGSLFIAMVVETIISYDDGIGGHTRYYAGHGYDGCICHNADSLSSVVVRITGPTIVAPSSVNMYRITMRGGPAVGGGFDFNVKYGDVDTVPGEITRKVIEITEWGDTTNDISHSWPQIFISDSVSWLVKYIAPATSVILYDTLYATGNSVNRDSIPDPPDRWNFAPNFVVKVDPSIGIQPISTVAERYYLGQNYPNPFNPSTRIGFSIPPGGNEPVQLVVYDILGRQAAVLVDERLRSGTYEVNWDASGFASGIYYYRLTAGEYSSVKKMILVK